jgi:hypothetical protein
VELDVAASVVICNDELLVVNNAGAYQLRWRFDVLDYPLDANELHASLGDALRASAYVVDQMA